MSDCVVEVVEPGLAVALQDMGRLGWRRLGVPTSGALDPVLFALANALAGNAGGPTAPAALEIPLLGPTLLVRGGPVRFALAGPIAASVSGPDGGAARAVPPWSSVTLQAGETLRVGAVAALARDNRLALGYLAVAGGVAVAQVLGSRSTYARAALGGVQGRAIERGDLLPCADPGPRAAAERRGPQAFAHEDGDETPIRLLAGPQGGHFEPAAHALLQDAAFTVTRDSDRMGLRLAGPKLPHSALGADIASDGVTPGAIQVPADGQPIVLLADCQTVGGYPKIATVIRADLPRLAHARPGTALRFRFVAPAEAANARFQLARRIEQWVAQIVPYRPAGEFDEAALHQCNLVSGVVRGDGFDD